MSNNNEIIVNLTIVPTLKACQLSISIQQHIIICMVERNVSDEFIFLLFLYILRMEAAGVIRSLSLFNIMKSGPQILYIRLI